MLQSHHYTTIQPHTRIVYYKSKLLLLTNYMVIILYNNLLSLLIRLIDRDRSFQSGSTRLPVTSIFSKLVIWEIKWRLSSKPQLGTYVLSPCRKVGGTRYSLFSRLPCVRQQLFTFYKLFSVMIRSLHLIWITSTKEKLQVEA